MPIYVARTITDPDGTEHHLADRDILARTLGYSATTIRLYCPPDLYDTTTGRALYEQAVVEQTLTALGIKPRPHLQGVRRAGRDGPARRRRKPT